MAVALFLMAGLLIDFLAIPFVILPFFLPAAYGATAAYFLVHRGLLARRLVRMPVSIVSDVQLTKWANRQIITFKTDPDQKAAFSYLHTKDPAAALARIKSAVPLGRSQS